MNKLLITMLMLILTNTVLARGHHHFTLGHHHFNCNGSDATPPPVAVPPIPKTTCAIPNPTNSLVVNVIDTGATSGDSTDDTAAIQKAVDQVAGTGGTVLIPDGIYMIDAQMSINLKSKMTLSMTANAVLKAIPNNLENYGVINVIDQSDINIVGGSIQGERQLHAGTTGEWGMGIEVNSSENIVIEKVTIRDMWGDAIYLGNSGNNIPNKNIVICSVIVDNNRRQGISIIHADGVLITNSIINNTNGTAPQAGIDLEPNTDNEIVTNVNIVDNIFLNNAGGDIVDGGFTVTKIKSTGNRPASSNLNIP